MTNNKSIEGMLDKKIWAVIGVSPNKEKFGYKIWKILKDNGYKVFPINPRYSEIYGEKSYPSLNELPEKPEVINFVVPAKITLEAVEEAKEIGIDNLWFQPGSWDKEVLEKADQLGLNHVENCVYSILSK